MNKIRYNAGQFVPVREFSVQRVLNYSSIRNVCDDESIRPIDKNQAAWSVRVLSVLARDRRPTSLEKAPSCCRRRQIQRVHAVALCVRGAAMLCFDRLPSLRVANVDTNVPSFFDEEEEEGETAFGTTINLTSTTTPVIVIDHQRRTSSR